MSDRSLDLLKAQLGVLIGMRFAFLGCTQIGSSALLDGFKGELAKR